VGLTTGEGSTDEDEEADDKRRSLSCAAPSTGEAAELIDRRRGSAAAMLAKEAGEDGTEDGSSRCKHSGDRAATDDDATASAVCSTVHDEFCAIKLRVATATLGELRISAQRATAFGT